MTASLLAALAVILLALTRRPPPRRGTTRTRRAEDAPGRRARRATPVLWDQVLDAMAAEVRGGATLRMAVVSVAANRCPEHALADPRTDLLRPPGTTDADEAVVWQALAAAAAFGGATAATVQAGANLLRERAAVRAEAEAHSAQARLSARVLTAVPLAFAGWSATASATFRRALASPPGVAAASAGLCLNLLGWWWMRRIVRAAS